jgi:hypothetical protein
MTEYSINLALKNMKNPFSWVNILMKYAAFAFPSEVLNPEISNHSPVVY